MYPNHGDMGEQPQRLGVEVVDFVPPVAQVVHLGAELDGDLLWCDPNVGLEETEPAAPLPDIAV